MKTPENSGGDGPAVSVVLPTHNRARLVGRSIRSVLQQTHARFELLVVDDGSVDDTSEAVRAISDRRIRYLRNERAGGAAFARNVGIRAASPAEFLGFIDDDEWLPRKLERQIAVFREGPPDLAAVGCGRLDVGPGWTETIIPDHQGDVFEDLLARRARGYAAPLILVRRRPGVPDLLMDEQLPCLEDLDYALRVARCGPFGLATDTLVRVHRDHGPTNLWSPAEAIRGYDLLARKYETELATRPEVRAYYEVCTVRELALLGRLAECRSRLRRALQDSSRRFSLVAWYLTSFLGASALRAAIRLRPIQPPSSGRVARNLGERPHSTRDGS